MPQLFPFVILPLLCDLSLFFYRKIWYSTICHDNTPGVIILIKDIERGKSDIFGALKDVRQDPKKRAHELVELPEDKRALDKLLGIKKYRRKLRPSIIEGTIFTGRT